MSRSLVIQAIAKGRLTAERVGPIWLVAQDAKFHRFNRKPAGRPAGGRRRSQQILRRIIVLLRPIFRRRLRGVVLYGSAARGDAAPDSDLDVLVLLRGPVHYGAELEKVIRALYPLDLEWGRPIHAMPVDAEAYEAGECALYRNAKAEGVTLWPEAVAR